MLYRNATFAFIGELEQVTSKGKPVTVREKATHELLARTVSLAKPLERFITVPGRRNDPFATIAEAIWVIAGRDDMAYLERYLERAPEFSDDGVVWRAAYGPRLRNWQGVDQVDEIRKLLSSDPESRRAVAVLFDPARDFVDTRDVPCNNWLHFLQRDGMLQMSVVVRSNDILWGFSGINTFEWSLLHEMMAHWLGLGVGSATFYISSLHLYDDRAAQAQRSLEGFAARSGYEQGWVPAGFATPWNAIDSVLNTWFEIEVEISGGSPGISEKVEAFPDPLLRDFLRALQIKWAKESGANDETLREMVERLGKSDIAFAVHEYLFRDSGDLVSGIATMVDPIELRTVVAALHREKDASYGNSWKRRGEQVSILANIARKVDRIENVAGGAPAGSETVLDTAADLLVYALKYETFLADEDAEVAKRLFGREGTGFSDGPGGFDLLIAQRDFNVAFGPNADEAARVVSLFDGLDQLVRGGNASIADKAAAARTLSDAAVKLLRSVAATSPDPIGVLHGDAG